MGKRYEEMTDAELDAEFDAALVAHEAGIAPFRRQGEAARLIAPTVPVSLRLPAPLLERIKAAASSRDMSYQRLIRQWIEAAVDEEADTRHEGRTAGRIAKHETDNDKGKEKH